MKKSLMILSMLVVCFWSMNTFGESAEDYRKDAEQGKADAQFSLGRCYARGEGVTKDLTEAVKLYRKAAEQGNANAQFHLGGCYYKGNGVTKDTVESIKWVRKAAEQGNANAQEVLKALDK